MQNEKKRIEIRNLLPEELKQAMNAMGQPSYRSGQIFKWLNQGVEDFAQMTNIPDGLRDALSQQYYIYTPKILAKQVSKKDGTVKYLWKLEDGNAVETVLMHYKYGNTICISTQVGCRQGCAFCASTIGGLVRSLQPYEMLNEVLYTQIDSGKRISHIVLMGIGEPLDNFDNVVKFLFLVNHPEGLNISMRHIALSTCGLIEKFDKLAKLNLQLTLSVSLHAPDDETRNKIMPANRGRGVDALVQECKKYFGKTGRRISFEYAMIDGVNDTDGHAELLAQKAKMAHAHVNIIPLNYVKESSLKPSCDQRIKEFYEILLSHGVNATIRRRLGSDIDASCGQLRRKFQKP